MNAEEEALTEQDISYDHWERLMEIALLRKRLVQLIWAAKLTGPEIDSLIKIDRSDIGYMHDPKAVVSLTARAIQKLRACRRSNELREFLDALG